MKISILDRMNRGEVTIASNDSCTTRKTLRPYQEHAVGYLATRGKRGGFLAMEMRLGKTLVVIRYLLDFLMPTEEEPVLVIAPSTVMRTWKAELIGEGVLESEILVLDHPTKKKKLDDLADCSVKWIIVNYESCIPLEIGSRRNWSAVVADESLRISNPKSQITKYLTGKYLKKKVNGKELTVTPFPRRREKRIALNGNPVPEGGHQLVQQLLWIQGSVLGHDSFWGFRNAYYYEDTSGYGWLPKPGTDDLLYRTLHANAFVLTRKQAKVGNKKIYSRRYVQMTPDQKRAYKSMEHRFEADGVQTDMVLTKLLYMHRIAQGHILSDTMGEDPRNVKFRSNAKINEIISLMGGELYGEPVIIWCKYSCEVETITNTLKEKGYRVLFIDGSVPQDQREGIRVLFQTGTYDAIVLKDRIGKVGLDLSAASASLYYSHDFSCDTRAQSEDRLVHPLQTEPKLIIDLLTQDTIDEHLITVLEEKKWEGEMFTNKLIASMLGIGATT